MIYSDIGCELWNKVCLFLQCVKIRMYTHVLHTLSIGKTAFYVSLTAFCVYVDKGGFFACG